MIDPSRFGEFVDRRAGIEDAKIRRCTCGSWVYGVQSCGTCGLDDLNERGAVAV